jgi:sulfite reductase alpha subunit-like flavoprotein
LIGPGTGIALPLALLEQRVIAAQQADNVCLQNTLYFGCRHAAEDHLYPSLSQHAALSHYRPVFSRDDSDKKLRYVQHAIKRDAAIVRQALLNDNAYIVLCGSAEKVSMFSSGVVIDDDRLLDANRCAQCIDRCVVRR